MMLENNGNAAMEVFSIVTENFKLHAMLVTIKDGRSLVSGWARFKDGEENRFFSDDKDKGRLRNKLLRACMSIASFYGVELRHEEIQSPGEGRQAYPHLTNVSRVLH
jgi:hypothetical protein